jgi:two-component system, OmpR family, sensor histidine kinase VanS
VTELGPRRRLRLPAGTVRLRLTLLYGGLFLVSGLALLVATYLLFRGSTGVDLIVPSAVGHRSGGAGSGGQAMSAQLLQQVQRMFATSVARNSHRLHEGLLQSGIALAVMTAISIALGWLVAGRVLRPLRTITATTRQISARNLSERLAFSGPRDELTDLADTVDGLLERLEAHVAAQQRFAANASHELRTPLAITQTMLEVARSDPDRRDDELVDRLLEVNTRATQLTEALLLLSRAGQRSFTPEHVDLSLIAEEAGEALLPLAEERGVTITTTGEPAAASGSHALLLQLVTNLMQNAIVHNLPGQGTVSVTTRALAQHVELVVANSGERLDPQLVSVLAEPFQRGTDRLQDDHGGVGLGLAIARSITEAHDGTLTLAAPDAGGLRVTVRLPPSAVPGSPPPSGAAASVRRAPAAAPRSP